jgi:hypothetical protein
MRRPRSRLLALVLAPSLAAGSLAGVRPAPCSADDDAGPLAGATGARALELARDLVTDATKGRKTGTEGGRAAEDQVASAFTGFGMTPDDPDGDYLDPFPMGLVEVTAPLSLSVDGRALEHGRGFVDLLYTGNGTVEAEVVFAGYGIVAPDRGWDDYAGIDVKGKVVLLLRGAPSSREGEFGTERLIGWKTSTARSKGAAAVLLVEGKAPSMGTIQERFHQADLPVLWVSSDVADRCLAKAGRQVAELKASRDAGEPGRSFATGAQARVEVHARFDPNAGGRSAMASIPGADPDLRKEIVLVAAHLDHFGVDVGGRVYPGADDDASGVGTILALAESLSQNGWRPKRTVVFCAFGGEEAGLAGSRALAKADTFAPKVVVAVLNLDMVGQGTPEILCGGTEGHPALSRRLIASLPAARRSTVRTFRALDTSDHWPFYERGIPSFFLTTGGDHPGYHTPDDVVANLKPECLQAAADVAGRMLLALADLPDPLAPADALADFLLAEGPRVVEGPAASKALDAFLTAAPGALADPAAFADGGWTCVVAPIDESGAGAPSAFAKVLQGVRARGSQAQLVTSASDLVNSAAAGRVGVLPRLSCPRSARAAPGVLSVFGTLGIRWVAPFDPASPPSDAERDAILDAAVEAKVLVDLTGLPAASLPAARARLKDAPATLRVGAVAPDAVAALRAAAGPRTLLVSADAAGEGLVATSSDDLAATRALVRKAVDEADLAEPTSPARARLRSRLGGAFVEALRFLR